MVRILVVFNSTLKAIFFREINIDNHAVCMLELLLQRFFERLGFQKYHQPSSGLGLFTVVQMIAFCRLR